LAEVNNDYFVIEKSKDNILFTPVKVLDGQGSTTNATWYSAIDDHPYNGTSYYRLKQVDFDGAVTYSASIPFNITLADNLLILPGDNGNSAAIQFNSPYSGSRQLCVYDLSGRQIFQN
jgi:hypothetical protein